MFQKRNAWFFQYNDKHDFQRTPLQTYPRPGAFVTWRATRWAKEMRPGDLVFFWETGHGGGLRGWGLIAQPADPWAKQVMVEIVVWESRPVTSRRDILPSDHLWHRWWSATNYRLDPSEARRLAAVFPSSRRPEIETDAFDGASDVAAHSSATAIPRDSDGPSSNSDASKKAQTIDLKFEVLLDTPPSNEQGSAFLQGVDANPRDVRLWFATNREPAPAASVEHFTGRRSEGDIVRYGCCTVHVPEGHEFGSLGSGWWGRWRRGDDRLQLRAVDPLQEEVFWNLLKSVLTSASTNDSMILFVHGYNVTFEGAALRAAQLCYDLKMGGCAFFSWPSAGGLFGYKADEASAKHSAPLVASFVRQLDEQCAAAGRRLHVVAHSMGNRVLVDALEALGLKGWKPQALDKLVFAAPDEDASVFKRAVGAMAQTGRSRTLYASNGDKPVWFSATMHTYARAGYLPPVTFAQGLDTIDASNIDQTFLGHSDFASERALLNDLYSLLKLGQPPDRRASLQSAFVGSQQYWKLT